MSPEDERKEFEFSLHLHAVVGLSQRYFHSEL